jgi:hypothetical protein
MNLYRIISRLLSHQKLTIMLILEGNVRFTQKVGQIETIRIMLGEIFTQLNVLFIYSIYEVSSLLNFKYFRFRLKIVYTLFHQIISHGSNFTHLC